MKNVVLDYLRKSMKFPNVWCPGCGNGIIMGSVIRAIHKLKLDKDKVVMVSGIGCSSRAPAYFDFNTLHTLHGRAIPHATGIKLANPEFTVFVITGDGDGCAIGGNHFIHACRRNIDLNIILFNNYIYGMTGGQVSPTTPLAKYASTSPYGNIDPPFDISRLAIGAGASFVARSTTFHVRQLDNLMVKAVQAKGLSMVEVITQCPAYYGRKNQLKNALKMMYWQKENTMDVKKYNSICTGNDEEAKKDARNKITTGILHEYEHDEYCECYACKMEKL